MEKKIESLIGYNNKIQNLDLSQIETNLLNPRKRFIEREEDELIESIISKGILNPIIVFKKNGKDRYVILDGERRYKACKKLNIQTIPVRVLKRAPTLLENLSLMFHIHNVREEWTEFSLSFTIRRIIEEMGKNIKKLTNLDIQELSKITSLSTYKIRKYLKFQEYPQEIIKIFLDSEIKEKPDEGVDPDILTEMHRPLKQMQNQMPELLDKYPISKIIKVCIKKKANDIIKKNKEFRLLSKSLLAEKRGEIRKDLLKDKIISFIENIEITPEKIYLDTAEIIYQLKSIIEDSEKLYDGVKNVNLKKLTNEEKEELIKKLRELVKLIEAKLNG